jgi:beta-glucosidase
VCRSVSSSRAAVVPPQSIRVGLMQDLLPIIYLSLIISLLGAPPSASAQQASDSVEGLLEAMTLEEKVGQMVQLTIEAVSADDGPDGRITLDPVKLREAIVDRHVGSFLNVIGHALTLEGWHELIEQVQSLAVNETRLGIPILYGIDAVHGHHYARGGTVFPQNIGLAATFDRDLVREANRVTATEVTATGIVWNFTPVLDVGRTVLWPRFFETFGESPVVVSELGVAAVEGMQSSGMVAATPKHYLGYGAPDTGRDRAPATLTERVVREEHLVPFAAAVEAGAKTIMINSGEIDGVPVHASHYWLTEVLRDELGFQGIAVTDWLDVIFLHERHRVAPTMRDAVRIAVDAGIDMSMTPHEFGFADYLIDLVRSGEIAEERIDLSVRRILTVKEQLGLFEMPNPGPQHAADFGLEESVQLAQHAARATITLLANDGTLPLNPDSRILVTGPAAASLTALNGGWTYTWQGRDPTHFPEGTPTLVDAVRERAVSVEYVTGSGFKTEGDVRAAREAAARADVVVLAIGEDAYAEFMGDMENIMLPEPQRRLAEAVIESGTPVVMVIVSGRPRTIHAIADDMSAILMAYQPGMEGARAIADVLYGDHNPSGRLPFTYPRHPNELDTYDYRMTQVIARGMHPQPEYWNPQFDIGHGLSYTTFEYSGLHLSDQSMERDGSIEVNVTVTNTGERSGRHSVILFTRQHFASITPPVRRLRDFMTISLDAGESKTVTFELPAGALRFAGQDGSWLLEPGLFDVMIEDLTATFELR